MDWLRWHFAEHRAVIIATAIIVVAFLALLFIQPFSQWRPNNNGFGPDWECTDHPGAQPTCIKTIQPRS
jgi:hypothetical protein